MKPTITLFLIFVGMSVAGQSGHQTVSSGAATEQNGAWSSALAPASPSLVSVSISPSNPTQATGFQVLLTATGTYSDGSTANITQSAAWSTGNPGVAIFGSVGTQQAVTCLSAGTSVITATSGSFTGSTTVTCLALTSIAITPPNPAQSTGSSAAFSANGTYSDGSVQSVTALATWTSSNTAVAAVGAPGDPQTVSCQTAGTSTVTAKVGTVSGSTVLTCSAAVGTTAGCGAGPNGTNIYDQSTCGNYAGAPYEDLATASAIIPPAPFGSGTVHNITGCTAIPTPAQGDVWRFANDINDGVGGTNQNCIQLPGAQNYVVDLAGHTLTGGISFPSGGITGVTIVNGTINCNIANGGIAACIMVNAGGNPSKSFMLSHLTVNNANSPTSPDGTYSGFEYVIYIEADGTTIPSACPAGADQKTFNGSCIEVAHVSTTPAAGYAGAGYSGQWCNRCTNIWMSAGGGNSFEVWNTVTTCGGYVDACQGIVVFNAGAAAIHNNGTAWTPYLGAGDNGRAILFDSAGKPFNSKCKEAFNNLIAPFNSRSLRTREEGCIAFHDNLMIHVQGGSNIQEGANDDYAENLKNNTIAHNTFMFEGGHGFVTEASYGLTVDSNNFVCVSNCSTVQIGSTQVDNYTFAIASMSRTAACVVTVILTRSPSSTSQQVNGVIVVNVQGTGTDFDVSGTAGNVLTSHSGTSYSYTQAGCAGAAGPISPPSGAIFWMAANATDNFAANGAQVYVKNSTIDPALTFSPLFVACGQQGHSNACTSGYSAQSDQNGGQTQIQYCNNVQSGNLIVPVTGTGAVVAHLGPDSACP